MEDEVPDYVPSAPSFEDVFPLPFRPEYAPIYPDLPEDDEVFNDPEQFLFREIPRYSREKKIEAMALLNERFRWFNTHFELDGQHRYWTELDGILTLESLEIGEVLKLGLANTEGTDDDQLRKLNVLTEWNSQGFVFQGEQLGWDLYEKFIEFIKSNMGLDVKMGVVIDGGDAASWASVWDTEDSSGDSVKSFIEGRKAEENGDDDDNPDDTDWAEGDDTSEEQSSSPIVGVICSICGTAFDDSKQLGKHMEGHIQGNDASPDHRSPVRIPVKITEGTPNPAPEPVRITQPSKIQVGRHNKKSLFPERKHNFPSYKCYPKEDKEVVKPEVKQAVVRKGVKQVKMFVCQICEIKFSRKHNLKRHNNKFHK